MGIPACNQNYFGIIMGAISTTRIELFCTNSIAKYSKWVKKYEKDMVDSITRANCGGNNRWCIFAVEILDGAFLRCDAVGVAAYTLLKYSPGKRAMNAWRG
jgi:hypothetical protein